MRTEQELQINVTPAKGLSISVEKQQRIIDHINTKLLSNPRQGFCFMGKPGCGKTYLMKAIRNAVLKVVERHEFELCRLNLTVDQKNEIYFSKFEVSEFVTLSSWQRAHLERNMLSRTISHDDDYYDVQAKLELKKPFTHFSSDHIRAVAGSNQAESASLGFMNIRPLRTLHLFMDEFDTQPTYSAFAMDNMHTFVNTCYEYAPRIREGNEQDFVQLVVAMNKSWQEFGDDYGLAIARRIAEMCVMIDFDEARASDPLPDPNMPDAIDEALGFCESTR